jgi:hypothetical protein
LFKPFGAPLNDKAVQIKRATEKISPGRLPRCMFERHRLNVVLGCDATLGALQVPPAIVTEYLRRLHMEHAIASGLWAWLPGMWVLNWFAGQALGFNVLASPLLDCLHRQ